MSPVGALSQGRVEEKIRKGFRQEVTLCRHSSLQKTTSWEKMCGAQFFNIFSNIKEEKKRWRQNGVQISLVPWEHCNLQSIWDSRELGKLLELFILPKYLKSHE